MSFFVVRFVHACAALALGALACGPAPPTRTATPRTGSSARVPDPFTLFTSDRTRLRGANLYQRRVYPELDHTALGSGPVGPDYSDADLRELAELGANYVHLSCPGPFAERPPYAADPAIVDYLDALLARLGRAGFFVVLAFRTGPGRSEFSFFADQAGTWFAASYVDESVWTSPAAQDAWARMTTFAAQRWGNLPQIIALEPLVEPNPDARVVRASDPSSFYPAHRGEPADWNPFAARLVTALRRGHPRLPAVISPMGHGSPEWLPVLIPVTDTRTIYGVHQYGPWQYTHQSERAPLLYPDEVDIDGDGAPDTFNERWITARLDAIHAWSAEHEVPIAITEFGVRRWAPDAAAFLQDQITTFERHGWAHALWMWHPGAGEMSHQDAFDILRSSDPTDHEDQSESALRAVVRANWSQNQDRASLPP
jgi:hypothetical protein